jgi:uncharacterized membrane protein YraQ (UPF0718 family)
MRDAAILLAELVALFLSVSFAVQIFQRRMGRERLRQWMGGKPVVAAIKGIVVGFVTPFCTFTAIPMLIGLRKAEVPVAGYVAFIVAAPVLDPVLFGALTVIVGVGAAVTYSAVAFAAAMVLALVAQRSDMDRHLKPIPAELVRVGAGPPASNAPSIAGGSSDPVATSACTPNDDPWRGWQPEAAAAWQAAVGLLRSFGPLLLVGVSIGLAIEAFVSPRAVADLTGDNNLLSIPIAALLGTPLYFSTELFVPIADALRGAGLGVGAIVALTIAGAGANVPEFLLLTRLAKRRLIIIFAIYIFAVATLGGLITETIV